MAVFADEFVGQYPVPKTLRFELRPVEETAKWLNSNECSILFNDKKRNEQYPVLKELLDEYYRYFIEKALTGFSLKEQLLDEAFSAYESNSSAKYETSCEKLREDIVQAFNKTNMDKYLLSKDKFKDLVKLTAKGENNAVVDSLLVKWMKDESGMTKEKIEKYCQAISAFGGFVTYLTDYKQARENMFTAEEKSTAIAFRVINQNMSFFFANIKIFHRIKDNYPDLYSSIKRFEKYFSPKAYSGVLSQKSINEYNECIGRPAADKDFKGINSIINEYRQKKGLKNRDLPMMTMLYKQILSDRQDGFVLDVIKDEEEAINCAKSAYGEACKKLSALVDLMKRNFKEANQSNMFVKTGSLTQLSNAMLGDWSILSNALSAAEYKSDLISLTELENCFNRYCDSLDADDAEKLRIGYDIAGYFTQPFTIEEKLPEVKKVTEYKAQLDTILDIIRQYKAFHLYNGNKQMSIPENAMAFSSEFSDVYRGLNDFQLVYDKIRNYATKKPYSLEKMKLSFDMPTMLSGWDVNKEKDNGTFLFIKGDKYYLGIADSANKKIFDFIGQPGLLDGYTSGGDYSKIQYKQISGSSKMLPKVVFAPSNKEIFGGIITKRILEIREKKLYTAKAGDKAAVVEWIEFMKKAIHLHPEWGKYFSYSFKASEEYVNVNEFYEDVDKQSYTLKKVAIPGAYMDKLVREHKLYLFQLYTKDFSDNKKRKGTDNLHTMYWKGIFSDENLRTLQSGRDPIIKLNGEAEMFMRMPSIERKVTHPHNQPIKNKNPLNKKAESTFEYDLIKDKRFTERKFYFHCPITLNFRTEKQSKFNDRVNSFVENNKDVCLIGIDRGERHLLYYTVINQSGEVLEQGSLNTISNYYINADGERVEKQTDYHELLDRKEKGRTEARQAWAVIENIKELKAGYLSQVVYKLTQLMLKYNAVVVLENLNVGFKRGRTKVEKQVYQKFEKAMIDKLNYLVFKNLRYDENGSFAKGLQLTAPFESFDMIGRQTGCIYYVVPSYTSHIDPKTGFVNLLNHKLQYENISKAQETINKFKKISYNTARDYFEFEFDYDDFGIQMFKSHWTICTYGDNRWYYSSKTKETKEYNVTAKLKGLFESFGVSYADGENMVSDIAKISDKQFLSSLLFYIRLVLQIRYTVKGTENEKDFILSPVEYEAGKFFDSREAGAYEPQNADANGAYHIALKGLMTLKRIKDGKIVKFESGEERQEWFRFMQEQDYKNG